MGYVDWNRIALDPSSWIWLSGAAIASFVLIALWEMRSPREIHPSWYRWSMLIQFAGFVLLAVAAESNAWFGQPQVADTVFDLAVAVIGVSLLAALIGAVVTMREGKRG